MRAHIFCGNFHPLSGRKNLGILLRWRLLKFMRVLHDITGKIYEQHFGPLPNVMAQGWDDTRFFSFRFRDISFVFFAKMKRKCQHLTVFDQETYFLYFAKYYCSNTPKNGLKYLLKIYEILHLFFLSETIATF